MSTARATAGRWPADVERYIVLEGSGTLIVTGLGKRGDLPVPVPADFPVATHAELCDLVLERYFLPVDICRAVQQWGSGEQGDEVSLGTVLSFAPAAAEHFFYAWFSVVERFAALTDLGESLGPLLASNTALDDDERTSLRRQLFEFHAHALGLVDQLGFMLAAQGALMLPRVFTLTSDKDLRSVSFQNVAALYSRAFPVAKVSGVLRRVQDSGDLREMKRDRNVHIHRGAPGIVPDAPGYLWLTNRHKDGADSALLPASIHHRRRWLASTLADVLDGAVELARSRLGG